MGIKSLCIAALAATMFTGCATTYPIGGLYQELKMPVCATANGKATKVGTAECKSILGLVAMGDASIETAKKSAGITEVTHVDWEVENLLGIIGKYKVIVYGN